MRTAGRALLRFGTDASPEGPRSGGRFSEHGRCGVDPDEHSGMPVSCGPPEELTGSAAEIEHRPRRHREFKVVLVAGIPGIERVIEPGEQRLVVRTIDHRLSLAVHPLILLRVIK